MVEHRSGPRRAICSPRLSKHLSGVLSGRGTGSGGSRRDTSRAPCQQDGRHQPTSPSQRLAADGQQPAKFSLQLLLGTYQAPSGPFGI